jgi:hypothetical protein
LIFQIATWEEGRVVVWVDLMVGCEGGEGDGEREEREKRKESSYLCK